MSRRWSQWTSCCRASTRPGTESSGSTRTRRATSDRSTLRSDVCGVRVVTLNQAGSGRTPRPWLKNTMDPVASAGWSGGRLFVHEWSHPRFGSEWNQKIRKLPGVAAPTEYHAAVAPVCQQGAMLSQEHRISERFLWASGAIEVTLRSLMLPRGWQHNDNRQQWTKNVMTQNYYFLL